MFVIQALTDSFLLYLEYVFVRFCYEMIRKGKHFGSTWLYSVFGLFFWIVIDNLSDAADLLTHNLLREVLHGRHLFISFPARQTNKLRYLRSFFLDFLLSFPDDVTDKDQQPVKAVITSFTHSVIRIARQINFSRKISVRQTSRS